MKLLDRDMRRAYDLMNPVQQANIDALVASAANATSTGENWSTFMAAVMVVGQFKMPHDNDRDRLSDLIRDCRSIHVVKLVLSATTTDESAKDVTNAIGVLTHHLRRNCERF